MKRLGRIHWMMPVAVLGIIVVFVIFAMAEGGPNKVAVNFLEALKNEDVTALTEDSYLGTMSKDDMRKQWEQTLESAKYYRFMYVVNDVVQANDQQAAAKVTWYKDYKVKASSDEHYEIPMQKEAGKWKVRVQGMSREMYPFLPRVQ